MILKLVLAGMLCFLPACGQEEQQEEKIEYSDGSNPPETQSGGGGRDPAAFPGDSGENADADANADARADDDENPDSTPVLQGTWITPCLGRQVNLVQFVEDEWLLLTESYGEDDCRMPLGVHVFRGEFQVGEVNEQLNPARNVDLLMNSVQLVLWDAGLVELFNEESEYGYDDWTLREGKEIIDRQSQFGEMLSSGWHYSWYIKEGANLRFPGFVPTREDRTESLTSAPVFVPYDPGS